MYSFDIKKAPSQEPSVITTSNELFRAVFRNQRVIPEKALLLGTFQIFQIKLITINMDETVTLAATLMG